jgi:anti-anti-sigma factor
MWGARKITPFGMEATCDGCCVRLAVTGELNLSTAEAFAQRVRELSGSGSEVLLDLSGVDFMDSTGLKTVLDAIGEAHRLDRAVAVKPDLAPQVSRLLQLTGTERILFAS